MPGFEEMNMPELSDVHVCERDARALCAMLVERCHPTEMESAIALASALDAARVVPAGELPEGVVRMGSTVTYVDGSDGKRRTVTVVHPAQADAGPGRISVLSPIGRALLGRRAGSSTDVRSPTGHRISLRIENVMRRRTKNAEALALI